MDDVSTGSTAGGMPACQLPWHLIPAFKPGMTDVRRLHLLCGVWPSESLSQLAPRAALLCEGSAFQKIARLDPTKLRVNSSDGVKLIVQTLGGVWGKTTLESDMKGLNVQSFQQFRGLIKPMKVS